MLQNLRGNWLTAGIFRWTIRIAAGTALFLVLGFLFYFKSAIFNRYVTFPKQQEALDTILAQKQDVPLKSQWKEFRGVCHSHSYISHDSRMTFEEILVAAKISDIDFICMTDHTRDDIGDYSWQWNGVHDGVLFIPGFEMDYGFMPWGLPTETKLRKSEEAATLSKQIHDLGGILFYAHSEEDRFWDDPYFTGMEIYNIHTDMKDEEHLFRDVVPDMILNRSTYPDLAMWVMYDPHPNIMAHWDQLNIGRKIVGITASDAHQNVGARLIYSDDDTVLLKATSPDDIGAYQTNFFSRLFLRMCFGKLEPGRELFHVEFAPYEQSLRFSNTHVLAKEQTQPAVIDALRNGRVFVGFDMLADARGFAFVAEAGGKQVTMGESIPMQEGLIIKAAAPFPSRMRLLHLGQTVHEETGHTLEFTPTETGKYRIEAEFNIEGEWWPWIYTNPLEITK